MERKPTTNKYLKALDKHIAAGRSTEVLVSWWNRLVDFAEIKNGEAIFYFPVSKSTGQGCYRHTGTTEIVKRIAV